MRALARQLFSSSDEYGPVRYSQSFANDVPLPLKLRLADSDERSIYSAICSSSLAGHETTRIVHDDGNSTESPNNEV